MTPVHSRRTRPSGSSRPQFLPPKYVAADEVRYADMGALRTVSSVSPNSEAPWSGSLAQPPFGLCQRGFEQA